MAVAVTRYQTADGSLFKTSSEAAAHEDLALRCEQAIESAIGIRRDIDSEHYVQHDIDAALQAKRNMLAILREKHGSYAVFKNPDDAIHPMSFAGRLADDIGGPIGRAWGRLRCINFDTGREYQQRFFALNPNQAPTTELAKPKDTP